ncbi:MULTISPECIES: DsbA family oxidoreductase [Streptomyces]|uniref:DsbA family oxidoreductase n=1 Tax=Streptomyces nondiastaticus TaxID=3154512 RepID=A0ABW6TY59_9ACTN|nr:DsbA family oxidoreductase [Streptomyces sp. VNUA116]WKU44917.1 DsbA family oxidoreductase [Streptomyces sp. VNUA116]
MPDGRHAPRRVDIVLDIICAHSYIGYTRFSRAVQRFRESGGQAEVHFHPFQLDPDAPDRGEPLLQALERKFGAGVFQETARVAAHAEHDGIVLDYENAVHTGTFEAHRHIALAAGQGLAEQMTERFFRAYFTDGVNIADPQTLERLARETGVRTGGDTPDGADEVRAGLERVRRSGVRSVPVFSFAGGPVLSGAQPEESYLSALAGAAG